MTLTILLLACGGDDTVIADTDDGLGSLPTDTAGSPPPEELPPPCAPAATLPASDVVEGDAYAITWTCSAPGAAQDDHTLNLITGPPGATIGADGWTVTVQTDPSSAGPASFFVEVAHERVAGLPETATAEVWVNNGPPGDPTDVPVDPTVYDTEFGLPVIHLFPTAEPTEEYVLATIVVGGEEQVAAEMKLRGASSLSYPKQSYTLRSQPADKFDLDAYGLDNRDRLVLISTFDDNSYVRQKMAYDLWEDIADHFGLTDRPAPHASFAVVYLDGRYHGLYVAIDHIGTEYFESFGLASEGNVYKSVNHDANFKRVLADGSTKTDLSSGWEKKDGLDPVDTSDLEALTAFAADNNAATFWADAPTLLDVAAFQDWFLFVSFTLASDSAGKNAYLYHLPGVHLWQYTPWDLNHSWGQSWTTTRTAVSDYDDFRSRNQIFTHFHDDPLGSTTLWSRHASLSTPGGPLSRTALLDAFTEAKTAVGASARRDWGVWGADYRSFSRWSSRTDFTDVDGEWAYLEQWISDRPAEFASRAP